MMQYRNRPIVIEAMQFTGEPSNFDDVCTFLGTQQHGHREEGYGPDAHVLIHTLEGTVRASVGDWIIRDVKGEFYPCKPDIFAATYEPNVAARKLAEIEALVESRDAQRGLGAIIWPRELREILGPKKES